MVIPDFGGEGLQRELLPAQCSCPVHRREGLFCCYCPWGQVLVLDLGLFCWRSELRAWELYHQTSV